MGFLSGSTLTAAALALSACVAAAPLHVPEDHPANSKGPAGLTGSPVALDEYRTPKDFDARAAADANAPSGGHAGHGAMNMPGMSGMQHGGMTMPPGGSR